MIQFTLGCVLIVLSLFFGSKEILANRNVILNREAHLQSEEKRVEDANKIKHKFELKKKDSIAYSPNLKNILMNQLNIDSSKYDFELKEPKSKGKVISVYNYEIKGYDGYGEIFSLFGDIEKVKGLFINDMCLNCNIKTKQFKREGIDISFKIEGVAYVYNKEK